MSPTTLERATYIFHHVFLPPKLPDGADEDVTHEAFLLDRVIRALQSFKRQVAADTAGIISSTTMMICRLKFIYDEFGHLDETRLKKTLAQLHSEGGSIPIHVRAQNAALLITKAGNGINVEAFELSPRNRQVIKTLGRLQRTFPGPALEMDPDAFMNPEFLATIANTLERMSHQEVANTRIQVNKAGQKLDEDRDTTHPKVVTELLMGFLRPMCKVAHVSRICKNTCEEVMWKDSRSPWRRSPLWLLIRVSLQLVMSRQTRQLGRPMKIYKHFMIFFMSHILGWASETGLASEQLQAMSSKIGRRLLKSNLSDDASWIHFVRHVLESTGNIIRGRWQKAIARSGYKHDMSLLKSLHFAEDIYYTLDDLDGFIMEMKTRENNIQGSTDFEPPSNPIEFDAAELPNLSPFDSKYTVYDLAALEHWVAENLGNWLQEHIGDDNTCAQLGELMRQYHRAAMDIYRGDPEAISVMMLSLLELWVACDRSATCIYGMLRDYDPFVPMGTFQILVLPFHSQMIRLAWAEEYMCQRQQGVKYHGPGIFREFGTRHCFPVRYFDDSVGLQSLLKKIEEHAHLERNLKKAELQRKKFDYRKLMAQYDLAECQYHKMSVDPESNAQKKRHLGSCQRCSYKQKANALSIAVHEWPLPKDVLEKKSTVFELNIPRAFRHWRDTTMYFLMDVLGLKYSAQVAPRSRHPLLTYSGLKRYFESCKDEQRISLLSQNKPHGITHRNLKKIIDMTENDICLDNGLKFRYFDSKVDCFLADLMMTYRSATPCVYTMPTSSRCLERFLFRPFGAPDGPPPNQAIASQWHTCPAHVTSTEYKSLCNIPLGVEVQWQNILVQLSMPQVDWKKLETCIFILQTIYQAGPPDKCSISRTGHIILEDEEFTRVLLAKIANTMERIKDNWESAQTLCAFACVTSRVLSLTLSYPIEQTCLEILQYLRKIVFKWVELVKGKASRALHGEERDHLVALTVRLALVCVCSFDTEGDHLHTILALDSEASLFILCSVTIQEWGTSLYPLEASDPLLPILQRRWKTLCYRARRILADKILGEEKSRILDAAIQRAWPAFQGVDNWSTVVEQPSCWLYGRTVNLGNTRGQLLVHFNLLTGEILVNGLPLSRLASEYETDPSYQRLFGHSVLEIMPSPAPGMEFFVKRDYMEHMVHLGLSQATDRSTTDLVVCAIKEKQVFQFLPPRLLSGLFPDAFVNNFVHWYDEDKEFVEFRPAGQAWKSSSSNWRLRKDHRRRWYLAKGEDYLVNIESSTAKSIACILDPVAKFGEIHCILHLALSRLEIDLPSLQLGFFLEKGSSSIRSKQSRGMEVDGDQTFGSLVGLRNRLMLKNPDSLGRAVIVPYGDAYVQKEGDHVQVHIDLETAVGFQLYIVDCRLGQLVDNGSLQSKLTLCYLHALTSFCIPDPLTGRTGTEQALTILRSAAVRSFETLDPEHTSILARIAALTPKRRYYPAEARVMQSVDWHKDLGFLAQHGEFYTRVVDIFDQDHRRRMLSPARNTCHPELPQVESNLLKRDSIRSSTFRVSEFGAEDHTYDQDHSDRSLDCNQESQEGRRAFLMSSSIYLSVPITLAMSADILASHMWKFLSSFDCAFGPNQGLGDTKGKFDAQLILEPEKLISQHWCAIHNQLLRSGPNRLNKFQAMIWFSTMAFAKNVDMTVLKALVSVYSISDMDLMAPPSGTSFYLSNGDEFDKSILLHRLNRSLVPIEESPDWAVTSHPGESRKAYNRRRSTIFRNNSEKMLEQFISVIQPQWPVRSPSESTFDGSPNIHLYVNVPDAMTIAREQFFIWLDNRKFRCYIRRLSYVLSQQRAPSPSPQPYIFHMPDPIVRCEPGFVSVNDILYSSAPNVDMETPRLESLLQSVPLNSSSELRSRILIRKLTFLSRSRYDKKYIGQLRSSIDSLQQTTRDCNIVLTDDHLKDVLTDHLNLCQEHLRSIYNAITGHMEPLSAGNMPWETEHPARHAVMATLARVHQWPRISPIVLLQQMTRHRWANLANDWKRCFVAYGLALAAVQRAERLVSLVGTREDLIQEIQNKGHTNWDPLEFPETLLVEIENGILIREVQEQIAKQMRTSKRENVVMQLNMGEGKSSVIIPITSAALANGICLVVVMVPKPQSRQMFQMLVSKLGGLLDRRVYHLPVCRTLNLGQTEANEIRKLCHDCMENGGVLFVQPEHILSLKLMGLENLISGSDKVGSSILRTLDFFSTDSRAIVDESDENFDVKYELIYTMGNQRPVEFSPQRWILIHQLLHLVREIVPDLHKDFPHSMELEDLHPGGFPRLRLLHRDAQQCLMVRLLEHICDHGVEGLPISRQPEAIRNAVFNYALNAELEPSQITAVENQDTASFWTDATKSPLLLLRGLFAGGVLSFCLGQKRWRVNYGLDSERQPPTRLVVPYRAKDKPAPRSEYSHPDVVIILTSLSYYYAGLEDDAIFLAFNHLLKSDQADAEYTAWVADAPGLLISYHHLVGVNLEDRYHCSQEVFPWLRFSKSLIDYFLAHVVFPKEMREFPEKLTASGWDIGEVKWHPTIGFSGTNDLRTTLPLDVKQLDLPEQSHTNALVMENLLRPENSVAFYPQQHRVLGSDANTLLHMVTSLDPPAQVILDVGAQIIELSNLEVAEAWLNLITDHEQTQAIVFFDDNDELLVLDRKGRVEALQISPFSKQLELCHIFLDEAHTRGTDLKLPEYYRAAVTLGGGSYKR